MVHVSSTESNLIKSMGEFSGKLRSARAIHWCANEMRNAASISGLIPEITSMLLANAAHAIDVKQGVATASFPEFAIDLNDFPSVENTKNFLMAEQIWIQDNPDQVQEYSYGLLQKLRREKFGELQSSTGVQEIMHQIILEMGFSEMKQISVLDPTFGYGVLSSGLGRLLPSTNLTIHGQEINPECHDIAVNLMKINGLSAEIRYADLLSTDSFAGETFDLVLLDAPFQMSWNRARVDENDPRFSLGIPSHNDASLLFLQAAISKLKSPEEGGGILLALTPHGNLVGEGDKTEILSGLVDRDLVQVVIALPPRLVSNTAVPMYLVVFSNSKKPNWTNKVQLVDVRSEFEELPGKGEKQRVVSAEGLSQIRRAVGKPQPLKSVRTLSRDELWLHKSEVVYSDCETHVWTNVSRIGKAKLLKSFQREADNLLEVVPSDADNGLGGVKTYPKGSYLSLQVESRLSYFDRTALAVDHTCTDSVSLMRLASSLLLVTSGNSSEFDFQSADYLAIPRIADKKAIYIQNGSIPDSAKLSTYILISFIQPERIPSICAWLNSSHGLSILEIARKQLNPTSQFLLGVGRMKEIVEFLALIRVPHLDSARMALIARTESEIQQGLNVLQSLRDEIWVDDSAIESVREVTRAISKDLTFKKWAEDLPYPLAASLRTYEHFALDDSKATDQLIHFWEATATFLGTYLLSALKQSDDLWAREIPRLREALTKGGCSFEKATIGTWRITTEFLSKRFMELLNSEDVFQQERAIHLLGGAKKNTLERLLSPKVSQLLGQANEFRNRSSGHAGTMSKVQESAKRDELTTLTGELMSEVNHAWSNLRLVRAGARHDRATGSFVECEIAMGPNSTFFKEEVPVNERLVEDSLYLIGENGSVPLLRFVHMDSALVDPKTTCYFYNRTEKDGARFVSYHLAAQNEVITGAEDLLVILNDISNLAISPLEDF